jgi:hypothetical protein
MPIRWPSSTQRLDRPIGTLFAVGSTLFALGSIPAYADAVGTEITGITYFVGSIFFTTAGFLQYVQAANDAEVRATGAPWRVLTWQPRRPDWWATAIQLAGTLLFNVNTFNAMRRGFDPQEVQRLVWVPDLLGSVCFLVASAIALRSTERAWLSWRPRDRDWRIAAWNMLGSVLFGISAAASKLLLPTGTPRNADLADAGTLWGAVCFLVGGLLLAFTVDRPAARPDADTVPRSA